MDFNLTEERENRIRKVVSNRQLDVTVVLENVHDPHNISAVMRTCDSVGIQDIYLIVTDSRIQEKMVLGKKSSAGSRKWVDVHMFTDVKLCFSELRKKYKLIIGTHLEKNSKSLYSFDFNQSTAFVFGNEKDGISDEALDYLDHNMSIPQFGMVQSLNISVACAVTLYEMARQRVAAEKYNTNEWNTEKEDLCKDFYDRHVNKYTGKWIRRHD